MVCVFLSNILQLNIYFQCNRHHIMYIPNFIICIMAINGLYEYMKTFVFDVVLKMSLDMT